jgi:hypothetical protein
MTLVEFGYTVKALWFITPKTLNFLAFQSFDFECTWWRLFEEGVMHTKFDIYSFIDM